MKRANAASEYDGDDDLTTVLPPRQALAYLDGRAPRRDEPQRAVGGQERSSAPPPPPSLAATAPASAVLLWLTGERVRGLSLRARQSLARANVFGAAAVGGFGVMFALGIAVGRFVESEPVVVVTASRQSEGSAPDGTLADPGATVPAPVGSVVDAAAGAAARRDALAPEVPQAQAVVTLSPARAAPPTRHALRATKDGAPHAAAGVPKRTVDRRAPPVPASGGRSLADDVDGVDDLGAASVAADLARAQLEATIR